MLSRFCSQMVSLKKLLGQIFCFLYRFLNGRNGDFRCETWPLWTIYHVFLNKNGCKTFLFWYVWKTVLLKMSLSYRSFKTSMHNIIINECGINYKEFSKIYILVKILSYMRVVGYQPCIKHIAVLPFSMRFLAWSFLQEILILFYQDTSETSLTKPYIDVVL